MHIWKLFRVQPVLSNDEGGGGGGGGIGDVGGQGGNSHLQEDLDLLNSDSDGDRGDDGDDDGTGDGSDDGDRSQRRRQDRAANRGERNQQDDDDDQDDDQDDDDDQGDGRRDDDQDDDDDDDQQDDQDDDQTDDEGDQGGKKVRVQGRPTLQQIRSYDKDLFKYLPGMRDIIFSEQKYREHIADPEQAAEFAEKSAQFDALDVELSNGSPAMLLEQLREGNAQAFTKVAENFMPELRKLDPQLYSRLTLPIIKEALFHAHNYGKQRGGREGDNIQRAAEWMSDFVFQNGGKIEPLEAQEGRHPAEIQLEKERKERENATYKQVHGEVNARIERGLVGLITEGMDARLNKFLKSTITEKVLDEIVNGIPNDRPFQMKLRGIWSRAKLAQYPENVKKQIVDAHLARARGLFREIRDRLTQEALGGQRPPRRERQGEQDQQRNRDRNQDRQNNGSGQRKRRFDSQGGRGDSRGSGGRREAVLDSSKIDYSRTSDADILSGDRSRVKLRGSR